MKNPAPSFQFYPQDFLADLNVQSMTNEECGRYIKLLCHCWIEDGLPIKGGSRVVDKWLKQGSTVAKCFYEKDGFYRHKRLDLERQRQVMWREKSRIGGRHSADNKKVVKGGSRVVQPKANTSSSSSSSSSIKDHKNDLLRDGRIRNEFDPLFDEFWKGYPKKVSKTVAREKFMILARAGKIPDLIKATNGYMDFLKHQRVKKNFEQEPMHPATFLMKDRWMDYVDFKYQPEL